MRRVIADRGFEHAIESVATAVAVEIESPVPTATLELRLEGLSRVAENAVLDALIMGARARGWRAGV